MWTLGATACAGVVDAVGHHVRGAPGDGLGVGRDGHDRSGHDASSAAVPGSSSAVERRLGGGELVVGADHVHDGVDQREVRERLREVAEVPAGARVDLLGVELQRATRSPAASRTARARAGVSPISASAETSQNEQIVNVPSSPVRPSSVSSTGSAARGRRRSARRRSRGPSRGCARRRAAGSARAASAAARRRARRCRSAG